MDNTIYYYQGLYGVIYFLKFNHGTAYVHENDGNFRAEYLNPVLKLINSKLERVKSLEELHEDALQDLLEMEDSTLADYERN